MEHNYWPFPESFKTIQEYALNLKIFRFEARFGEFTSDHFWCHISFKSEYELRTILDKLGVKNPSAIEVRVDEVPVTLWIEHNYIRVETWSWNHPQTNNEKFEGAKRLERFLEPLELRYEEPEKISRYVAHPTTWPSLWTELPIRP